MRNVLRANEEFFCYKLCSDIEFCCVTLLYNSCTICSAHSFYTTQNLTIENQSIKNFESCYERDLRRGLEGRPCTVCALLNRLR